MLSFLYHRLHQNGLLIDDMAAAACMETFERVQTRCVNARSMKGGSAFKDNMHSERALTFWKLVVDVYCGRKFSEL